MGSWSLQKKSICVSVMSPYGSLEKKTRLTKLDQNTSSSLFANHFCYLILCCALSNTANFIDVKVIPWYYSYFVEDWTVRCVRHVLAWFYILINLWNTFHPHWLYQSLFLWTTVGLSILSDVSSCQCLEEDRLTSDLFNVQFVSAAFV